MFDNAPDILHCTYQMPLRAKGSCNIYTIHDLVPLRLPFTTLDNKRQTYKLLRKIAAEALALSPPVAVQAVLLEERRDDRRSAGVDPFT